MSIITGWIKEDLYLTLFDNIDNAFPEHNFTRFHGGWKSNCAKAKLLKLLYHPCSN